MGIETVAAVTGALLPAVAQVVKVFWGISEPEKVTVVKHETSVPISSDDQLLADFGLRNRTKDGSESRPD
jgi:hypothetical protein